MKKETVNGCCAVCGNASLLLCVDQTEYTPLQMINGEWTKDEPASQTEIVDGEDTTRLLCPECGEYHVVPDLLIQGE